MLVSPRKNHFNSVIIVLTAIFFVVSRGNPSFMSCWICLPNIESVPVSVLDLEPGEYTVSITYLNKPATTQKMSTEEGALKLTVPMTAQEVAAVEIKKN